MSNRLDVFRIDSFARHESGALDVKGRLTRTGVLKYADGNKNWSELRHEREVFDNDSLESLKGAPFTVGHPGKVTPENWAALAKGHVRDDVRRDGKYVTATIRVSDAATIKAIEGKKLSELSCGYTCEVEDGEGDHEGEKYHTQQKRIRYNHVGVGAAGWGRAGSEVKLLMDGAAVGVSRCDEVQEIALRPHEKAEPDADEQGGPSDSDADDLCQCGPKQRSTNGRCIVCEKKVPPFSNIGPIHGTSMDMPQANIVPFQSMDTNMAMPKKDGDTLSPMDAKDSKDKVEKTDKAETVKVKSERVEIRVDADKLVSAELEQVKAERDVLKSRCDSLEAKVKELSSQDRFDGAVNARVSLLVQARTVLGAEFKTDGVDDVSLMKAVIAKCDPKLNMDSKSNDYVRAVFDMVSERAEKSLADQARIDAALSVEDPDDGDEERTDSASSQKKMLEDAQNAWRN